MPWKIKRSNNKFQVVNSETGAVKGSHDTEEDARKQMAALYANVPESRKDMGHMDIHTKTVQATIEDTTGENDDGPGTFDVVLSTPKLDRDGEQLKASEWELPLPEHITFVNDHTHKVNSIVGSAEPTLEDGKIVCHGTYATTDNGQDTRKLVKGRHLTHVSVAYREKRGQKGGVTRELVNGSFVVVPSNTDAKVLSSKDFDLSESAGQTEFLCALKDFVEELLDKAGKTSEGGPEKPYGNVTYGDPGYLADGKKRYPLDTEEHVRNAPGRLTQNAKRYTSEQLSSIRGKIRSAAKKFGIEISDESPAGKKDHHSCDTCFEDVVTQELPAPDGAPDTKSADESADERTLALALGKAQQIEMQTKQLLSEGI